MFVTRSPIRVLIKIGYTKSRQGFTALLSRLILTGISNWDSCFLIFKKSNEYTLILKNQISSQMNTQIKVRVDI